MIVSDTSLLQPSSDFHMDTSKFKTCTVRRGHTYRYYVSPAAPGRPTLFFIHGFPSSSLDWARQVAYFEPKGFGIIVPDCLGYGGTSKPVNQEEFRWKLLADDLIDILDVEKPEVVIGIGHDWYYSASLFSFLWLSKADLTAFFAGDLQSFPALYTTTRVASARLPGSL